MIALDPGGTTGVVLLDWDGTPEPKPEALLGYWQVDFDDMPAWLDSMLLLHTPRLLVIERFIISPRTVRYTRQPEALYTIGGAIFLARLSGIPVHMQTASDAKDAYPNTRLTEMGFKVPGKHAKDALRHALLACLAPSLYSDT